MNQYIGMIDFLIIVIILFGPAIYSSFLSGTLEYGENIDECNFSSKENIYAIISQAVQLFIVMLYLYFRGVHLFSFEFYVSIKEILFSICLFCILGFCMDIVTSLKSGFQWIFKILKYNIPILSAMEDVNLPLVIISFLNGFYEEFFFLIVCTLVNPKYSGLVFVIAVVIRILIHTYQGWSTAILIGVGMGALNYLLFTQVNDNLFVYMFSHGIADLFGLSFFNML